MKNTRIILFSFGILFAVLAESNGAGNGCEWSGCQHGQQFVGHCNTGVTGGMGRHKHLRTKNCQLIGFKDFCCDNDCHWFYSCDGMTAYPDDMEPPQLSPNLKFCCRITGVIPPGGYVPPVYEARLNDNKATTSQRPNNGFVGEPYEYIRGSDNRTIPEGGGFRYSDGNGGFRKPIESNPTTNVDAVADNNQPINNAEAGGFRNSAGNGGFRNSAGTGGFRTK